MIAAMKAKGNTMLMVSGSMAAPRVWRFGYEADTPQPEHLTPANGLWAYNLRGPYNDMKLMEEITRASGLDYIILRPGSLVVEPARGNARVTVSEDEVPSKRVVMYADFAAWILDQIGSDEFLNKTVSIFSETLRSEMPTQSFESSVAGLREMKEQAEADLARDAALEAQQEGGE
jgi:hypothetical protein